MSRPQSLPPPPIRGEETPYNWAIQVGNDPALSLMMHPAAEMFSWGEDGICENCFRNPIMARNVVEEPPELIVIRAPRKLFSRRDLGSILTSVELSSYLELKQGVFHDQFVKTEDVRYELFAVFVQVAPRRAEQPEITDENEPVDDYRSMFKAKSQWAEFPEENEEGPFLINDIDDWEWNSGLASIDYKRRGYVLAFRRLAEGIIPSKRSIEYQTSRLDDLAVGFNANIIPNPGVMTLTFEVGEGSGEGPEGSTTNPDTIVDRVRMRAVPFADLIMTIPMDSLQFPENNPTGRLLIEFQDRQNQVVETFEMRGILRDLLNKRPKEEPEAKKHNGVKKTRRRRSRVRDALRNALRRKEKKEEGEEGEGN
ncbi:uncharacterized protein N7483_003060 [Penicillium malachiteum]|uniref:uncharacterized protein n=1 Tax=Penicillium malachiteum TaxID=1324776 RepID=UPI0025482777|nr:uncharacterized protein N7483_003060 [Penicillium malachiteum]KAJ5728552.1 hypothetical protein N7483_003060 [Penicillium malachiteum]